MSTTSEQKPDSSQSLRKSDEVFRLLVEGVQDYAIFLLGPDGVVMTWNAGAERIKGYSAPEIIGHHFSKFYSADARESGWPQRELEIADSLGRFSDEGWRVRKDGSTFWASVVITALRNPNGGLRGFSKVTRDLTERRALEQRSQELNKELRTRMNELTESRNLLEVRSFELQRLSGELVRVQDAERRRIARELHDDLGQIIVALKMNLDTATDFPSRGEAIELTEMALAKVRNLSFVLHPPLLDESGLLPALHLYLEGFKKRSDLRITFDYKPIPFPRFSSEIETGVFRVIQEAVTNVHRHSGSPDARVELYQHADRMLIKVRDFGKGVAPNQVKGMGKTGVGVSGMKERIAQLGGQLHLVRAEPGLLVEASIPLFE